MSARTLTILSILALTATACGSTNLEIVATRLTDPRTVVVRDTAMEPRRLIARVAIDRPTRKLEYFLEQHGTRVTATASTDAAETGTTTIVLDMVQPDHKLLQAGHYTLVVRGTDRDGHTHGGSQKDVDYDGP
jgi:hypothetical protein